MAPPPRTPRASLVAQTHTPSNPAAQPTPTPARSTMTIQSKRSISNPLGTTQGRLENVRSTLDVLLGRYLDDQIAEEEDGDGEAYWIAFEGVKNAFVSKQEYLSPQSLLFNPLPPDLLPSSPLSHFIRLSNTATLLHVLSSPSSTSLESASRTWLHLVLEQNEGISDGQLKAVVALLHHAWLLSSSRRSINTLSKRVEIAFPNDLTLFLPDNANSKTSRETQISKTRFHALVEESKRLILDTQDDRESLRAAWNWRTDKEGLEAYLRSVVVRVRREEEGGEEVESNVDTGSAFTFEGNEEMENKRVEKQLVPAQYVDSPNTQDRKAHIAQLQEMEEDSDLDTDKVSETGTIRRQLTSQRIDSIVVEAEGPIIEETPQPEFGSPRGTRAAELEELDSQTTVSGSLPSISIQQQQQGEGRGVQPTRARELHELEDSQTSTASSQRSLRSRSISTALPTPGRKRRKTPMEERMTVFIDPADGKEGGFGPSSAASTVKPLPRSFTQIPPPPPQPSFGLAPPPAQPQHQGGGLRFVPGGKGTLERTQPGEEGVEGGRKKRRWLEKQVDAEKIAFDSQSQSQSREDTPVSSSVVGRQGKGKGKERGVSVLEEVEYPRGMGYQTDAEMYDRPGEHDDEPFEEQGEVDEAGFERMEVGETDRGAGLEDSSEELEGSSEVEVEGRRFTQAEKGKGRSERTPVPPPPAPRGIANKRLSNDADGFDTPSEDDNEEAGEKQKQAEADRKKNAAKRKRHEERIDSSDDEAWARADKKRQLREEAAREEKRDEAIRRNEEQELAEEQKAQARRNREDDSDVEIEDEEDEEVEIVENGRWKGQLHPVKNLYRQNRQSSGMKIPWNQKETELLMKELDKRPNHWGLIIDRHGPNGTESRTLKYRTVMSLKDKAKVIKEGYISGFQPIPEYLKDVKPSKKFQAVLDEQRPARERRGETTF